MGITVIAPPHDRVTVEFRRHSLKDGAKKGTLGPEGHMLARAVGEVHLRGKGFNAFRASPRWRTHQTLCCFHEGAGDFDLDVAPPTAPFYVEYRRMLPFYRLCHAAEKRGKDMLQTALDADRALVTQMAKNMAAAFETWVSRECAPGTNGLIVGHSPEMEMVVLGLGLGQIPSLAECEGFRLVYWPEAEKLEYEDRFTLVRGTPDLDPAAIRANLGIAPFR